MRKWIAVFLLLVLLIGPLCAEEVLKPGTKAPNFQLPDLKGNTIALENFQKPTLLVFFTSWSKSCQALLKELQKLYDENKQIEILAVSFDKKIKNLENFVTKTKISYPVLLDQKLSCLDQYQILILPTIVGINQEGIIEKVFIDYDENVQQALADWADSFLKQK